MAIVKLTCPKCNGNLSFDDNRKFGFCEFCGAKVMIQKEVINVNIKKDNTSTMAKLSALADQYLATGDYKSAMDIGEKMSKIEPTNAKAYHIMASVVILFEKQRGSFGKDNIAGCRKLYSAYQKYSGDTKSFEQFVLDLVPELGIDSSKINDLSGQIKSAVQNNDFEKACSLIDSFRKDHSQHILIYDIIRSLTPIIENKMKSCLKTDFPNLLEYCKYMVKTFRCINIYWIPTSIIHWYIGQIFPRIKDELNTYENMALFRLVCVRLGLVSLGKVLYSLDSKYFTQGSGLKIYVGSEIYLSTWDMDNNYFTELENWYSFNLPSDRERYTMCRYRRWGSLQRYNVENTQYPRVGEIIGNFGDRILDDNFLMMFTNRRKCVELVKDLRFDEISWPEEELFEIYRDSAMELFRMDKSERKTYLEWKRKYKQGVFIFDDMREQRPTRYMPEYMVTHSLNAAMAYSDDFCLNGARLFTELALCEEDCADCHYLLSIINNATNPELSKNEFELAEKNGLNYGIVDKKIYELSKVYAVSFVMNDPNVKSFRMDVSGEDDKGIEVGKDDNWKSGNKIDYQLRKGKYKASFHYKCKTFFGIAEVERCLDFSVPKPATTYELQFSGKTPKLVPR